MNDTVIDQLYPTLVFHGIGDSCLSSWIDWIKIEAKDIYGTDIECVNLSELYDFDEKLIEELMSFLYPSDWMAEKYCKIV